MGGEGGEQCTMMGRHGSISGSAQWCVCRHGSVSGSFMYDSFH